jgi:hypothetical protein
MPEIGADFNIVYYFYLRSATENNTLRRVARDIDFQFKEKVMLAMCKGWQSDARC